MSGALNNVMYSKLNTIVIVLTEMCWVSIHKGEILEELELYEGSPLLEYQNIYPEYHVLQATTLVAYKDVLETVNRFLESPEHHKAAMPVDEVKSKTSEKMETKPKNRRDRRIAKRKLREAEEAKAKVNSETQKSKEPEMEVIAPPLMLVEHNYTLKERIVKTVDLNTERLATGSKVGLASVIDVVTNVVAIPLWMAGDLVNYAGSTAIHKLNVYEGTVKELMENRRKLADQYEEAIIHSPKLFKEYTENTFNRIKEQREKKLAEMKAARTA